MDPLADIRKVRHRKYVKDVVLPNVKEMIHTMKDPMNGYTKLLAAGFIRKFLPECINVDPIEEEHIPPLFRMRLKLNSTNLVKPDIPTVSGDDAQIDFTEIDHDDLPYIMHKTDSIPIINHGNNAYVNFDMDDIVQQSKTEYANADIDDIIQQSKTEYEMNEEMELSKAIESSLQNTPIIDNGVNDDDNIDNILFEQAIMESLTKHIKHSDDIDNANNEDENEFYVCFDIRVFGPDPQQPIYFMELPYYFSTWQMDLIRQRWNKVNPDTSTGQQTQQDIEYMHNMAVDMCNL